jgi:hypothetical protein
MSIFEKNYYCPTQHYENTNLFAFVEGPRNLKKIIPVNSSSINTKEIDFYRQGVEMTQDFHNIGTFKISAGTPGHIVQPNCFGITNSNVISENYNQDLDFFDPIYYIKAQTPGVNFSKIFTFPVVISEASQSDNFSLNGIIEPFSIRAPASFSSLEFPNESHRVRGNVMGGNNDPWFGSSDRILTVDFIPTKLVKTKIVSGSSGDRAINIRAFQNDDVYLDSYSIITASLPLQPRGYIDPAINSLDPYDDSKIYIKNLGMSLEKHGNDMLKIFINSVTSSIDSNYIVPGMRSAAAGFTYDSTELGTDSIVYGGMTY